MAQQVKVLTAKPEPETLDGRRGAAPVRAPVHAHSLSN